MVWARRTARFAELVAGAGIRAYGVPSHLTRRELPLLKPVAAQRRKMDQYGNLRALCIMGRANRRGVGVKIDARVMTAASAHH